jgi:Sigma-70 region 2
MGYSMKRRESVAAWAVLMRAAVNGDAGAYRQFLASLAPVLRATARRNCARVGLDGGEAEDVVQETLLAIHLKRYTWDLDRPIGPWITAIARQIHMVPLSRCTEFPEERVVQASAGKSDFHVGRGVVPTEARTSGAPPCLR